MLKNLQRLPRGERLAYLDRRVLPLHAMLGSAGHVRETDLAYDWDGLKRGRQEFALFQYTLAGEGRLRIAGAEHAMTPGTAMLLHFPAENRYWLPATSGHWEFIYLCLYGREIMRLWPGVIHAHGAFTRLAADAPPVLQAAAIVRRTLRGEIDSAFDRSALAYDWIMRMLALTPVPERVNPHLAALERARRHAEAHFAAPLGVDDLARVAGFSRYHFTRLFTAHAGLSPAAWLVDRRVKEAARLLRESRLPLKEIATRCGFRDPAFFGKTFARRTGQPPGAYRRSGV